MIRIPLRGNQSGTQYAGWKPRSVARRGLGNRTLVGQRVPVAGGVTLNADVYTPAETALHGARYPAVVCFAAYSTERHTAGIPTGSNEIGSPPVFTDRGYCPVIVERRGMGRSGGEQGMFFSEQDIEDHLAVIAWAAEQPWCDGDVVLYGISYYGMTQPVVALRRPPALRGLLAHELCTAFFGHLVMFGGVPALHFLNIWMGANFTQDVIDYRMSPNTRALISQITNGPAHAMLEKVMHRKVDSMLAKFTTATPTPQIREIYANWLFDQKSRQTATIPDGSSSRLGEIDVPFVAVQNLSYFNLHQYGAYELFEKASTPADRKWLILAPPAYELPVYSWQGEALAFFDHILYRTDNGYAEQPAVRYWTDGTESFRTAGTFPPAEATTTRLQLASAGEDGTVHELVHGPAPEGANSWAAVPLGLPVLGGLDDTTNQTLAFEFEATTDMLLAGAVTANLRFSCNEIDSYVVARLCRVDAAGELHHLSLGALRPAARGIDPTRTGSAAEIVIDTGTRVPLVPGESVDLRFSLTPGPVHITTGERLRLDIASRTDLLRKSPGDGYAQFDLPVPPYFSRNTLHFGGASWIEIDLLPATLEQ